MPHKVIGHSSSLQNKMLHVTGRITLEGSLSETLNHPLREETGEFNRCVLHIYSG